MRHLRRLAITLGLGFALLASGCGGSEDDGSEIVYWFRAFHPSGPDTLLEQRLVSAGVEVLSRKCGFVRASRSDGMWQENWDRNFLPAIPLPDWDMLNPGVHSYYFFEVRARDVPAARELGFQSPLSEQALSSQMHACET